MSHVKDHLSRIDTVNTGMMCLWSSCSHYNTSLDLSQYKRHVSFHPYHTYLKWKGLNYQISKGLPACVLIPDPSCTSIFSENETKCNWTFQGGRLCGEIFDNVSSFYSHVADHVKESSSICRWADCSFVTTSKWLLSDHMRVHTKEKIIACPNCGLLFSNNTKYKDHLNRQAIPTDHTHSCSICKKSYATARLLKEHTRKHINTKQCPHCPMTCTNQSSLMYHITYRHSDVRPYTCALCQSSFKTEYSLSEHLVTHGSAPFQCSFDGCHYQGKSLKALKHHQKIEHSKYNEYCCHICDLSFKEGHKLTVHLKKSHGFTLPPGHSRFRYPVLYAHDALSFIVTTGI
jgi:uncharacterized C2H2 Zn-finger protein